MDCLYKKGVSEFCIFLNFRKYGRVLNMRREAIMEEF